jgi:SNF2 family DNA or RNA helicase
MMPALFQHQEETVQFLRDTPQAFVASSPGVGKTRSVIELVARLKAAGLPHRTLVFCPKTILTASWGNDIRKFSNLTFAIADAAHRKQIVNKTADFVLINHDGVSGTQPENIKGNNFAILVVDEATAFKNPSTRRSKAMLKISEYFPRRILMSGTPSPNGVLDLWNQFRILSEDSPLGNSYYRFRAIVCEPVANGQFTKWQDKPGSAEAVADMVRPMTIRHQFQDVLDIPPNHQYAINVPLPAALRGQYDAFVRHTELEHADGLITAKNAGAKLSKLMQIASGAVYLDGETVDLDNSRARLVLDLIEAREQCIVAYNWRHQAEALSTLLTANDIPFGIINGDATGTQRAEIVEQFQAGKLRVILAHPATASHGLTLTAGTTTIWVSPTWNSEHFIQFNHRIFRAGQTRKTETIVLLAENTVDEFVYEKLANKLSAVEILLAILNTQPEKQNV